MIVAEYEGLFDWVKEKLGIGYVKLKDYTDLNLLKEHRAILNGLNVRNKVKCSGVVCSLYVEKDKTDMALRAIGKVESPMIKKEASALAKMALIKNIPLLAMVAAVPLVALVVMRLRK